jgi:hypothetical protein
MAFGGVTALSAAGAAFPAAQVPTWEPNLQAIDAGLLMPNGGSAENAASANRVWKPMDVRQCRWNPPIIN